MIVKVAEKTFADKTWRCPGIRITGLSLHLLCKTKTNTSTLTSNKEETTLMNPEETTLMNPDKTLTRKLYYFILHRKKLNKGKKPPTLTFPDIYQCLFVVSTNISN